MKILIQHVYINYCTESGNNEKYEFYCAVKDYIKEAIELLEHAAVELFQWFSNNQVKASPDKCHLITIKINDIAFNVEKNPIKSSKCEHLLGFKIDYMLTFNSDIDKLCKKGGQKIYALSRIVTYMNVEYGSLFKIYSLFHSLIMVL